MRQVKSKMYSVEVRDRIMIAHSLPDPSFGPAQNMHGATYVVDVAFFREELSAGERPPRPFFERR